jgi:hypothetical protein
MSHFLYIHKDLTNVPGVWKIGVAQTPYSAVRARQKYCWNKFHLDYLYFGLPGHIELVEKRIKCIFNRFTGKQAQGNSANTEMIKIDIAILLQSIEGIIKQFDLKIHRLELPELYSAANSSKCPFGIPTESSSYRWLQDKAVRFFGSKELEQPLELITKSKTMS